MKRIWRMAGVVTVCMALGFATLGADIQTAYAQEEVRGAGAQTADGWSYETKSDGTLTITGYSGTEKKVTVPATIDGKSVSGIGSSVWSGLHCFHVHLPDWYTDHNRTFWIRYSRSIPLCDRIHLSAVPSVQGERDFERKRKECCKGKIIRQKAGDRYGNICCRSNFGNRCVPDRAQHDS